MTSKERFIYGGHPMNRRNLLQWTTPVIVGVTLPAHAATSAPPKRPPPNTTPCPDDNPPPEPKFEVAVIDEPCLRLRPNGTIEIPEFCECLGSDEL